MIGMKNNVQCELLIRYTHIKLHLTCLCRLIVNLFLRRISLSKFFEKALFFIKGITRALQLDLYSVSDDTKHHVLHGTICNQPSGSLMVSSSSTLIQV